MYYIVFDMEFNKGEIIQIGAYRLDEDFNILATFNRYIKPSIYEEIEPRITEMTQITTEQLQNEASFPEVYKDFVAFTMGTDSVFCTWSMIDLKVLFRNAKHFQVDTNLLPSHFINIQPFASLYLNQSRKKLLGLEAVTMALDITVNDVFHNALHDAYYTTMIFKKIYTPSMVPQKYDPNHKKEQPRQRKRVIDFDGLIKQFEKMHEREMSIEEADMIKLAFKMGYTHQFIKEDPSD